MDRIQRAAVILRLIEELREHGSWCGETHIQKATLFLQDFEDVPLDYEFILYKHGPYSFELRDEITALRADNLIFLEPHRPYGPRIAAGEGNSYIQRVNSRIIARYDRSISYIANKLGSKGVMDLERLATAFFITDRSNENLTVELRANRLVELKPHISLEDAIAAVEEVDNMKRERFDF